MNRFHYPLICGVIERFTGSWPYNHPGPHASFLLRPQEETLWEWGTKESTFVGKNRSIKCMCKCYSSLRSLFINRMYWVVVFESYPFFWCLLHCKRCFPETFSPLTILRKQGWWTPFPTQVGFRTTTSLTRYILGRLQKVLCFNPILSLLEDHRGVNKHSLSIRKIGFPDLPAPLLEGDKELPLT